MCVKQAFACLVVGVYANVHVISIQFSTTKYVGRVNFVCYMYCKLETREPRHFRFQPSTFLRHFPRLPLSLSLTISDLVPSLLRDALQLTCLFIVIQLISPPQTKRALLPISQQ